MRPLSPAYRFSVAPMMDWTDRHCRYFHRQFSKNMLLYTEMVTAQALVYGDNHRFLQHSECEHPLALQLGGSDPEFLAKAVKIAEPYGFCEINLNVGCPSDRVQSGRFGACLMREPELVAQCFQAMQEASGNTSTEITIKCRIGVDDQDPYEVLPDFVSKISVVGCKRFVIHARKALLKGLSPKDNRSIPPLNYDLVYQIKRENPDLIIVLNGGLQDWEQVNKALQHIDGVMIGRDAYHRPANLLLSVDDVLFGESQVLNLFSIAQNMIPYIEWVISSGGRAHDVTRHMLGLFWGLPGAGLWRKMLSGGKSLSVEDYVNALYAVQAVQEV